MSSQGVKTTKVKITIGKDDKEKTSTVTVKPHVRMIKGKPVMVAGYTYSRTK